MPLTRKLGADFIRTFWLVPGGCASAVLVNPARSNHHAVTLPILSAD